MPNLPTNYIQVLEEIKLAIRQAHYKTVKTVNYQLFEMYWTIGEKLFLESQENWGKSVVEKLSQDLQAEFNGIKGFSAQNLWLMRQLYTEYKNFPNLQQLAREIGWSANTTIIQKIKDQKAREFYLIKTAQECWSRAILIERIKHQEHLNFQNSQNNFDKTLSATNMDYLWTIKDEYHFDFLELGLDHSEKQLEDGLVAHITRTLGQFGRDFCFMGRQFRLEVSDKEYFVDLLFYHRKLKCLIAIELKTTEFKVEHSQQLSWYLHLLDKQIKYPEDSPSIGILICRNKDDIVVEYALEMANNPIGIATYSYQTLPEEIAKYLPSEDELKNIFKNQT